MLERVSQVPDADWLALESETNPFEGRAFLHALEQSDCLTAASGWVPRYLAAENDDGRFVAFVPMFLKSHSYGEYFFDYAWASPMERSGLRYYPKLTIGIPFTPATGRRVWTAPDVDRKTLVPELMKAALVVGEQLGVSSVHWLFCTAEEQQYLGGVGYGLRHGIQFHWTQNGYESFDDMLMHMTRKRRKEVRRERRKAHSHGLDVKVLRGTELSAEDWDALYRFYRSTTSSHRAIPYLSEAFFAQAGDLVADRVVCSMAYRGSEAVAGTLNFVQGPHLYGRYWGSVVSLDCLHFEMCYYALIEWCIKNGLTRFEAGAQGYHKLARGFLPTLMRAGVYVFHEGYRSAVHDYLQEESNDVMRQLEGLNQESPFVQSD